MGRIIPVCKKRYRYILLLRLPRKSLRVGLKLFRDQFLQKLKIPFPFTGDLKMAIQDTSTTTTASTSTTAAPVYVPASKPLGSTAGNPFGFGGVTLTPGRLAGAPIRNLMGAESYVKLAKEMKEIAKDQNGNPSLEISVLELDRNVDPNLHFAAFVVTAQSTVSQDLGVGYNIVIMEATGEPPKPQMETVNGEQIEIPRFTEAAADNRLNEITLEMLRARFGNSMKFYTSDTQVVPADFDYEDKEAVRGLTANAAMAATVSLTMFAANGQYFTDLDLPSELNNRRGDQGDADLSFIYNFHPQVTVDHLKLPTRASVVVQSATGYRKNQRNNSLNSDSGPKTLSETCGYVELLPIAPRQQMQQYMANPYAPTPPRLAPVFVMTKLSSSFAFTPAAMLLNILVASDLNKGYGWVSAFANKTATRGRDLDLTDVTAITIDIPSKADPSQPEPRPAVPASGMTMDNLMTFLGSYCFQDLNLALDVPMASPTTWYLSLFAQAAQGTNPNAITKLNQSMDRLTGGHFSKIVGKDVKIFATQPLVVEYGYWEDGSGQRRAIEDVDYVAVCNYADANNNPQIVERWTNSFLQTGRAQAARLKDRREIIQEVTGHTAVFVGRKLRCFFNGAWLAAGVQALANAGITTSSDGRGNFGFGGTRGYAEFLTSSAMPSGAGWTNAFGGSGGGFNFGTMNSTPWGSV